MSARTSETPYDGQGTLADLILCVKEDVRQEFEAWNVKHVREVLEHDLRRPIPEPSASRDVLNTILGVYAGMRSSSRGEATRPPWLAPNAPVDVSYNPGEWHFEPTPEYEYCTPADGNRYVGDDSCTLLYDPLTERTTPEEHEEFLDLHDDLAWSTLADPSDEFISLETAARLKESYGRLLQEIHDADVLIPPLFDDEGICGVYSHGLNRDFPDWARPSPARIFERPENQSTNTSVTRCIRRECITLFLCTLHDSKSSRNISTQPIMDLDALRRENEPCGPDCGLHKSVRWTIQHPWPDSDKDLLREALIQQPAMLPCVYAAMWDVQCTEVFIYRKEMFPKLYPDRSRTKRRGKKKTRTASGDQRWRGCTCSHLLGIACIRETCKCLAANRECDPAVCGHCGAGDVEKHSCGNVSLQRRAWKKIEVRQSTWGYGAFVLEPTKKGEVVTEYVGEIIREPTVESREYVAKERGRHYLYDMDNSVFTLDASYAGNSARYINHDSRKVNCLARGRLVGGSHRIAIIAGRDIDVGEELFLNYGKRFPIPPSPDAAT